MKKKVFFNTSSCIPYCLTNRTLSLYKYNNLVNVELGLIRRGLKLGEFFFTRKPYYFPQKDRSKKKCFKR